MPWTLSHPAAVLPLRRYTPTPLNLGALVIGSMTPDVGYYIDRFDLAIFSHTLLGSLVSCLPIGIILLLLFYVFARPICYSLPSPHRQALLPICPSLPAGLKQWVIVLLSLLIGTWTHNFWDAFTHEGGWFVLRIPWLQQPAFHIRSTTVYVFLVLQELSTLVGFVIVAIAYWLWLRRQTISPTSESDLWRYLFWPGIFMLSVIITFPSAVHYAKAAGHHDFRYVRSILFREAIYAPLVIVPIGLAATSIIYLRRHRSAPQPLSPIATSTKYESQV
jgi:Domain of unknown function (DUF4184)